MHIISDHTEGRGAAHKIVLTVAFQWAVRSSSFVGSKLKLLCLASWVMNWSICICLEALQHYSLYLRQVVAQGPSYTKDITIPIARLEKHLQDAWD